MSLEYEEKEVYFPLEDQEAFSEDPEASFSSEYEEKEAYLSLESIFTNNIIIDLISKYRNSEDTGHTFGSKKNFLDYILTYIFNYYFVFIKTQNNNRYIFSIQEKRPIQIVNSDDELKCIRYIIQKVDENLNFSDYAIVYNNWSKDNKWHIQHAVDRAIISNYKRNSLSIIYTQRSKIFFYIWFKNHPEYKQHNISRIVLLVPVYTDLIDLYEDVNYHTPKPDSNFLREYAKNGLDLTNPNHHIHIHRLLSYLSYIGDTDNLYDKVINNKFGNLVGPTRHFSHYIYV
jgi:hypothetical protein